MAMKCPKCGAENLKGKRYCGDCGQHLGVTAICLNCGAENPEGKKFCGDCGQNLLDKRKALENEKLERASMREARRKC
jgi:ribosomal protein L40E